MFSAGNEGEVVRSTCTMEAPGIAKNVLAVGASASDGSTNVRATEFVQPGSNTTIDTVAFFSSYGPTTDGRVKPEVVAPGDVVRFLSGENTQLVWGGMLRCHTEIHVSCGGWWMFRGIFF